MNITQIGYNYQNINNNTLCKQNTNISFNGSKTAIMEKAKYNAGCVGWGLFLTALSPLFLLSEILLNNKKEKIKSMMVSMRCEYEDHLGNLEYFKDEVNNMNNFLDKHAINNEYAKFVKEAIEFLRANFEQTQYNWQRLAAFPETNKGDNFEFYKFINTIEESAKAAVSKNEKGFDKKKLDKDIQNAREIINNAQNLG